MPVDVFCAAVSGRAGSFSPAGRIVMVSFVTIFQRKKWRGKGQRMRQFSHPGHVFLRRYESDQVRRHYLNCINRAVHLTLLLNYLRPQVMIRHRRIQQCRALQTRISTNMGQIYRAFRLPQIIPSLHSQPHRCISPGNRLSQLQSHDGRNSNPPPRRMRLIVVGEAPICAANCLALKPKLSSASSKISPGWGGLNISAINDNPHSSQHKHPCL